MSRVKYNQPGYVGYSMSERARAAYDSGEKPKSKWTKRAMLEAIEDYCEYIWDFESKRSFFESKTKQQLFDEFFDWSSWHHTGKFARETDFYDVYEPAIDRIFEEN